jgi:glycerol-3-phosphate dehydrogenase
MKRNLGRLADELFDILVVGGGIHGAAIVREAVARGFRVALIEQGDFGQATSANSLKIIHGGLRYLQQADLKRMRQSLKARRMFMEMAPHLVHPQPFLVPIYGHGMRGKEAMAVGLAVNDLLSWDRNRSLPPDNLIPNGKVISREECLTILPHIKKRGLTGGAVWYDGLAANTERLTLEFILDASEMDAAVTNYVRAKSLVVEGGTIQGVQAEDRISRIPLTIRSQWVINAAGPWLNSLLTDFPNADPLPIHWTKGINLIIDRPMFSGYGAGLGEDQVPKTPGRAVKKRQRLFFFVPWQGRTMVGTAYNRYDGDLEHFRMETGDIQDFLDDLNIIYPPGGLTLKDVSFFHVGLLPVSEGQDPGDRQAEPDRHFRLIDNEPIVKAKGLISVKGTKYTTAPLVAEKVVDLISIKGDKTLPVCGDTKKISSYDQPALLNDLAKIYQEKIKGDQGKIARHLHQNYGTKSRLILGYLLKDRELSRFISEDPPIMAAEIVHGVREESALKLSDVVFRRTNLGQFHRPSSEALQATAEIMTKELGWDGKRTQEEIQEVLEVYRPLRNKG